MTDQPHPQGLSPFARSISSLFGAPAEAEDAAADQIAPEDVASDPSPSTESRGAAPQASSATGEEAVELKKAVARYLASSEGDARQAAAAEVRERYGAARSHRLNDAMADALGALARLGGSRPEAAELGRELIGPVVASILAARLAAAAAEVRSERASSLALLGDDMVRAVADMLNGTEDKKARHALIPILTKMLPCAPDVTEELVGDDRWYAVRNAVFAIGEARSEAGLQHLTATIVHPHEKVRRQSVVALQKIGGETAQVLVLGRLEDSDSRVRASAARATGALKPGRGVRELTALLERETDEDVIAWACRALGSLGDPVAVPTLERRAAGGLFSKPSTAIRVAAFQGLAAIGTPHAMRLLAFAGNDKDPEVRKVAEAALRSSD